VAVIVSNLAQLQAKMKREMKRDRKQEGTIPENGGDPETSESVTELEHENFEGALKIFEEGIGLDNYYPTNLSARTKILKTDYFMLLPSLEQNCDSYQRQQKLLDDLVDKIRSKEKR
jgi:hypothetical protein